MSNKKKVSEMTEAQKAAKRESDRKYRERKRLATKKTAVAKKVTTEKYHEVKPDVVNVHTIKPGDEIRWTGFTPDRIFDYAMRLAHRALEEIHSQITNE